MKTLFFISAFLLMCSYSLRGQFRPVKGMHKELANAGPTMTESDANNTLHNFFETARQGKRKQWEKTLSTKILPQNKKQEVVLDDWYSLLNRSDLDFYIYPKVSISNPKKRIYNYTIKGSRQSTHKNTIVLVKEDSEWKVLHMSH